jgi:hypothetical protein
VRAPITSERDAFWFTVACVAAIVVAVFVGWLVDPLAGLVVLAAELALGAAAYVRAPDAGRRAPLREAIEEPHPHGARPGQHHVLVIANETLEGEELRGQIVGDDGAGLELDVLAPVLTSPIHYGVTDIDREIGQARARLDGSLRWARDHGIRARGRVGDPDPVVAIEDELRDFGADEVIVVTHRDERTSWQERVELDRLGKQLDLPVRRIVI